MIVLIVAIALCGYAYAGYPGVLVLLAPRTRRRAPIKLARRLPRVSVVLPVYNEAPVVAETLEAILALDYPASRRQILVISDASTDGTDAIVATFADRGVQLVRQEERRGKTAAENAAWQYLDGEIILCTDASVRLEKGALRALVAEFEDPTVGVASGRDVSISRMESGANPGESAYVGYEMWIRERETIVGGIVGASGCLYATRAELHRHILPEALSRDFGAVLHARLHGYRSVSSNGAICYVPRSASLRQEYRRKVRTMTRGLGTLFHYGRLLDPFRYGLFAWMLASHKLARWLVPWAAFAAAVVIAALARDYTLARVVLAALAAGCAAALIAWMWPAPRPVPRVLAAPAFAVCGLIAGMHAWIRLFIRQSAPVWEPTRRERLSTAR